jgi:oligopeptide/dipeptide ABC transporter ATP-binding protein
MSDPAPLLEVEDLVCTFATEAGPAAAVAGVSFTLAAGESVGLVGESGCGKSVTALALMGLLGPGARTTARRLTFAGTDLTGLDERGWRSLRGNRIGMVFQEPMTALNPVLTTGEQVAEVLRHHRGLDRKAAWQEAIACFRRVGIPAPEHRVHDHPHQMSGGMRQRVVIAMAIACGPQLLVADEPTTALDVTIQAQILDLLSDLRERTGLALLLITHDLGVVARACSRVLVMYAGTLVEALPVDRLFHGSRHPYTRGLIDSLPRGGEGRGRLSEIPGTVPPITARPPGCAFAPRCSRAQDDCRAALPPLTAMDAGHALRCYHPLARGSTS